MKINTSYFARKSIAACTSATLCAILLSLIDEGRLSFRVIMVCVYFAFFVTGTYGIISSLIIDYIAERFKVILMVQLLMYGFLGATFFPVLGWWIGHSMTDPNLLYMPIITFIIFGCIDIYIKQNDSLAKHPVFIRIGFAYPILLFLLPHIVTFISFLAQKIRYISNYIL